MISSRQSSRRDAHDHALGSALWGRRPERVIPGALLFGSAAKAKAVAAREAWVGWSATERARFRWRIVNNNRFLVVPGVQVPHLASHVLGLAARRVPADWLHRYGYRPVQMETFVEAPWAGTCYRAANWQPVGTTAGRGRQDRYHEAGVPIKIPSGSIPGRGSGGPPW